MKERAARERFGDVVEISRPEFMTHVTEASKSAWVAVYLYQHGCVATAQRCTCVRSPHHLRAAHSAAPASATS